jgi:proline dehydrogenase
METSPAAGRLTSRFVAGKSLDEGLAVCRRLASERILATLDHLGENVAAADEAEASREAYLKALSAIGAGKLPATVSVKLSQLGLDVSEELCRSNVEAVVKAARSAGTAVEFDMESSPYVDATLRMAGEMRRRHGCVRVAIQAYLRRSAADVEELNRMRIPVRLCKGAYKEPPEMAFPSKADVDASYIRLASRLLEDGEYPALATHDPRMIGAVLETASRLALAPERFEFQMLYGIRRDLQRRLVQSGYRLRLYVPYGNAWYPYFMRRLAERPANLFFLARNLFRS